jgi:hypothetical protein
MDSKKPDDRPEPVPWVFPELPIITAPSASSRADVAKFPELPIVTAPAVSSRSEAEKYGTLFYLGLGGLVVVLALVTWFAVSVYQLRDLWAGVYALNDLTRPEAERIEAGMWLSRDARLDDHQRFEMSLSREIPERARYVLAESVGTEAVARDPRTFALAVARSPNWPVWLRLLYTRLLTYSAAKGYQIPVPALKELAANDDSMTRIWAAAAILYLDHPPEGLSEDLSQQLLSGSQLPGPDGELCKRMIAAKNASADERTAIFDAATLWLRQNHADAARVWKETATDPSPIPSDPGKPSSPTPASSSAPS